MTKIENLLFLLGYIFTNYIFTSYILVFFFILSDP